MYVIKLKCALLPSALALVRSINPQSYNKACAGFLCLSWLLPFKVFLGVISQLNGEEVSELSSYWYSFSNCSVTVDRQDDF